MTTGLYSKRKQRHGRGGTCRHDREHYRKAENAATSGAYKNKTLTRLGGQYLRQGGK